MKKNKNYYKLTLQFNDSDIHEEALSTIKQLDRKKSEFIAQCVVFYMKNSGDSPERIKDMLIGNNFNLSEQSFDDINDFIKKDVVSNKNKRKLTTAPNSKESNIKNNPQKNNNVNNIIDDSNIKSHKNESSIDDNLQKDENSVESRTNKKITNTIGHIDEDDLLNALDIFNNN